MKKRTVCLTMLMALALTMALGQTAEADFGRSQWIGAITRGDAHIPQGRTFSGSALKEPEVKAAWAAVDTLSRRSIWLKRSLRVRQGVRRATAYVCGLGFYELYVDGTKVGDDVMAPSWSDYDKTVYYNQHNLSPLLSPGQQELRVLLGNGFYNEQGGRYHKMKISFGPPTLRLRLVVEYADGSRDEVVSDASWLYSLSPVTFNSIYGGEDYDATAVEQWRPVVVQEGPAGMLRPQMAFPMRIMERYAPMRVERLGATLLFDMGQNLSGFPEVTVSGQRGLHIRLTPGETLAADGHVNQRQTGRPHYYDYTLGGQQAETWHPHFTYYGFRYLEVEGAVLEGDDNPEGLPVIHALHSCFVHNSAPRTGHFECSSPLLNQAHRLIDRAVRSNWQAVWTDCPHREKLGWLEQDWLVGPGLVCNYDCRTMIEQTMRNIADAQYPSGAIPTTAPQYTVFPGETWGRPFNESPEWAGTFIMLPTYYRQKYGSDSLVRHYLPQMIRYVDYLATQDSAYILQQGLGDWYDYRDGERAGFAKNTTVGFVSTAHYYRWTLLTARYARSCGHPQEAHWLQLRADSIRQALVARYYQPQAHQWDTGSQCAQSIALCLDLQPEADRPQVLQRLVDDIHAHGDRLTTGDIGNHYLFRALLENGQHELFFRMLHHYGTPGYGYQLLQGMTTLTEQWNPVFGSSMNHFMMGHLENHLIPNIVGIRINAPAIVIAPRPMGSLTWASGSTTCPQGQVAARWSLDGQRFTLEVDIPEGAEALVHMPYGGQEHRLAAGHHSLSEAVMSR